MLNSFLEVWLKYENRTIVVVSNGNTFKLGKYFTSIGYEILYPDFPDYYSHNKIQRYMDNGVWATIDDIPRVYRELFYSDIER